MRGFGLPPSHCALHGWGWVFAKAQSLNKKWDLGWREVGRVGESGDGRDDGSAEEEGMVQRRRGGDGLAQAEAARGRFSGGGGGCRGGL